MSDAVATGKKQPKARTSITVDRAVYDKAVALAEAQGRSFSALVEDALRGQVPADVKED